MKNKELSTLALGLSVFALAVTVGKNKKSSSKSAAVSQFSPEILEYPGYKIIDCKSIKVTDFNKAKKYAFDVGYGIKDFWTSEQKEEVCFQLLFGSMSCAETLTDENAYLLLKYAYLGILKKVNYTIDVSAVADYLGYIRNVWNLSKIDVKYDLLLEIINTVGGHDYPGYIIANCKYFYIYDKDEAYKHAYDIGKILKLTPPLIGLKYYDWVEKIMGKDCSPETLTQGIESLWELFIYSGVGSLDNDMTKDEELINFLEKIANNWAANYDGIAIKVPNKYDITTIIKKYEW